MMCNFSGGRGFLKEVNAVIVERQQEFGNIITVNGYFKLNILKDGDIAEF